MEAKIFLAVEQVGGKEKKEKADHEARSHSAVVTHTTTLLH